MFLTGFLMRRAAEADRQRDRPIGPISAALCGERTTGSVTVTNVRILAPHLTAENHLVLLEAARHKSKRDVERIVAGLRPLPDVPALVRRLPALSP